jgi:hypothetical protein
MTTRPVAVEKLSCPMSGDLSADLQKRAKACCESPKRANKARQRRSTRQAVGSRREIDFQLSLLLYIAMSFRTTARRLAAATGKSALTTSAFTSPATAEVASQLLPPLPLYRRLLRIHRKALPIEMRVMGDEYVKVSPHPCFLLSYSLFLCRHYRRELT